jgi:hypothetical protein
MAPEPMKSRLERIDLTDPQIDVLIGQNRIVASGRYELRQRLLRNPNATPSLSGGDIDAQWDMAESCGDETVGGSNGTPDQNCVDQYGEAFGLPVEVDEEVTCCVDRERRNDVHRWELDPASSEDYWTRRRR